MLLKRFLKQLSDYGVKRLLTSPDIKISASLTFILFLLDFIPCQLIQINVINLDFVSGTTPLLTALTSFVIVGLSILVSFTDEEFLAELVDLEVYQNILFIFLFNILLVGFSAFLSIIISSYSLSGLFFYMFLFFLMWSLLSLASMLQLIVNVGMNKAEFERNKREKTIENED